MLERFFIEHCSPTLAGLKTANLFNYTIEHPCDLDAHIQEWNQQLNRRGVFLTILDRHADRALIYVYRKSRLQDDLQQEGTAEFLSPLQYDCSDVEACLKRLRERIAQTHSFPHEIGLFLSYPLEDVIGFIENGGQNYRCVGCWKVYCDKCEAEKLFAKFRKCKQVYTRLFHSGRSITQLTIAA